VAADLRRTHELTSKHLSAAIMNVDDYESLPTNSVAVHMTAGAVAGIMEHCVMYPFDSVKVYRRRIRYHLPDSLHNLLGAAGALPVYLHFSSRVASSKFRGRNCAMRHDGPQDFPVRKTFLFASNEEKSPSGDIVFSSMLS